ncbi:hypothetical protein HNQ91_001032 [Filimonas zeae]|uniref:Uncharacterized protein n=1 Tax=Filimonas zeae TaxID=1737353 RepID=A0A917MUJ2_9BACT|nr:hypothetical protein [Filimonas zeae]MDR6338010.1 hypothetical protein [Filimonas zeae]GGH61282.1 hypothetical protein GCM10011379_10100 [Filimonas zeae]
MENPNPKGGWIMFSTSNAELHELLVSMGTLTIGNDFLKIENYPFEPSLAFRQPLFTSSQIDDIDCSSYPVTIRVNDELIFLRTDKKAELEDFARKNNISVVKREMIWEWILEPFLDTEYTEETDRRSMEVLSRYGFTPELVSALRAEVETQMLKYNFDTMLWEWCVLGASDVLRAMRTKYNKAEFSEFYKRVMSIALSGQP